MNDRGWPWWGRRRCDRTGGATAAAPSTPTRPRFLDLQRTNSSVGSTYGFATTQRSHLAYLGAATVNTGGVRWQLPFSLLGDGEGPLFDALPTPEISRSAPLRPPRSPR
jgi:hypothetical protein